MQHPRRHNDPPPNVCLISAFVPWHPWKYHVCESIGHVYPNIPNTYMASHRLAENKRWIAWSFMWLDCFRYPSIIWPVWVVRSVVANGSGQQVIVRCSVAVYIPGNLRSFALWPVAFKRSVSRAHWVDLPDRSQPSTTIKRPRDMISESRREERKKERGSDIHFCIDIETAQQLASIKSSLNLHETIKDMYKYTRAFSWCLL